MLEHDNIQFEYGSKTRQKMEHELLEAWKRDIGKCQTCGRKENLTLDHIIPLLILKDFGFDPKKFFDKDDMRLLCRPCNQLKSNHLDFNDPRTEKLLLKYIELLRYGNLNPDNK